jgi:hypothetical protein
MQSEVEKPPDPSLRSQLHQVMEADPLNKPFQIQCYLEALQKAPGASEGTKRKWRKTISL